MKPELGLIPGADLLELQSARWFARLRADDVSEQDQRRWRDWMEADPRHAQAYRRYEQLWSGLADYTNSDMVAEEIRDARRAMREPRHKWQRRLVLVGFGAAALLVLGIGTWLRPFTAPAETLLVTALGERRDIHLEDGTQVSLDADSQLRVVYSRKARDLALDRGRIYLEVAGDPTRPLTVRTGDGNIRAVGTAFDVHRRHNGTDVMLVEGRVLLSNGTPEDRKQAQAQTVAMTAGQQARLVLGEARPRIQAALVQGPPAWRSGRLVFSDQPLADAVEEFNRYSASRIELADPALTGLRVNGVFRSEDPRSFLDGLGEMYPVQLDTSTSGVVRIFPREGVRQRR